MQLTGEVKEEAAVDVDRQQQPMYARSADNYLRADANSGKMYYDLNAATRNYNGAWLSGQENVVVNVGRMRGQWMQFCRVPADVPDGVLLRGNVMYRLQNGGWSMSPDVFEGVLRSRGQARWFVGRTTHTFYGGQLPNGMVKVSAELNMGLNSASHEPAIVAVPARPQGDTAAYGSYERSEQQINF